MGFYFMVDNAQTQKTDPVEGLLGLEITIPGTGECSLKHVLLLEQEREYKDYDVWATHFQQFFPLVDKYLENLSLAQRLVLSQPDPRLKTLRENLLNFGNSKSYRNVRAWLSDSPYDILSVWALEHKLEGSLSLDDVVETASVLDGTKYPLLHCVVYCAETCNDRELLKSYLQKNQDSSDINFKDKEGNTPLLIAATYPDPDMVEDLILAGENIDAYNGTHDDPLMLSAINGYRGVMEVLVKNGADLHNSKYPMFETTLLMFSAQNGHEDVVVFLLDQHVDLEAKDADRRTALMLAATKGRAKVVEQLVAKGANINVKDRDGYTPLMLAAMKGHTEVVEFLLKQEGIELEAATKNDKHTALMLAALGGHTQVVKCLLEAGVNVNTEDDYGYAPLVLAVFAKHTQTVETFVQAGVDPNAPFSGGWKPLIWSASEGDLEVLCALLKSDSIDVDAITEANETALMRAAKQGYKSIVQELLKAGANPMLRSYVTPQPLYEHV
jgi:ankyrin repeat protein